MKRLSALAFVTTLLMQSIASAADYYPGVTIVKSGTKAGSASGSMMGAKHNAESGYIGGGYIGCTVYTGDNVAPRLTCQAGNKYSSLRCYADAIAIGSTDFPRMMDAVLGLDAYSWMSFSANASGYCSGVDVGHSSEHIP